MFKITFDSLPEVVQELNSKIDNLMMLLQSAQLNEKENDLLDIQDAAAFLNLTKSTLYNKVNKRELPVMKKGKRLYFSKKELLSYIRSGKILSDIEIKEKANEFLSSKKIGFNYSKSTKC